MNRRTYYVYVVMFFIAGIVVGYFGGYFGLAQGISRFGVVIGVLVLVGLGIFFDRGIPKKEEQEIGSLRKEFKKHFGLKVDRRWFSKDTSYKFWRDKNSKQQIIIQHRIDIVLPPLAKTFLDFCEKRNTLMEPYYSAQAGKNVGTELDNKKDLKRLEKLENDISLAENEFQEACKAAREARFDVRLSAKEYVKTEKSEES